MMTKDGLTPKEIRTRYNTLVSEMTADEAWAITVRAHYAPEAVAKTLLEHVLLRAEGGYTHLCTPLNK